MYLDTGRFSGFQYVAPQALHATEQHTAMQAPGAVEIPFAPGRLPRRSPPPPSSPPPYSLFTSLPFLSSPSNTYPSPSPNPSPSPAELCLARQNSSSRDSTPSVSSSVYFTTAFAPAALPQFFVVSFSASLRLLGLFHKPTKPTHHRHRHIKLEALHPVLFDRLPSKHTQPRQGQ